MWCFTNKKKTYPQGQTTLEYAILAIVIISALVGMQRYFQRGVQGKWRESLDSLGKQYDPQANILANHYQESNAQTVMWVAEDEEGVVRTYRTDVSNSNEIINEIITLGN